MLSGRRAAEITAVESGLEDKWTPVGSWGRGRQTRERNRLHRSRHGLRTPRPRTIFRCRGRSPGSRVNASVWPSRWFRTS